MCRAHQQVDDAGLPYPVPHQQAPPGRCDGLGADALRRAARSCPALETLRVGGSAAAAAAAAAALPDIVPLVLPPAPRAAGASWEELPDPDACMSEVRACACRARTACCLWTGPLCAVILAWLQPRPALSRCYSSLSHRFPGHGR